MAVLILVPAFSTSSSRQKKKNINTEGVGCLVYCENNLTNNASPSFLYIVKIALLITHNHQASMIQSVL